MGRGTEYNVAEGAWALSPLERHSGFDSAKLDAIPTTAIAETMQQLIDDLPEQIALLDDKCNILAANRAWIETVMEYGYLDGLPGGNYRDFCASKAEQGYEPAIEAVAALNDICSGVRSFWQLAYNGGERWNGRDYQISVHKIKVGAQTLLSVTRIDLTELIELRRAKADFPQSLLDGQTLERRRMARELHDSTSQLLTAAGLLLGRLKRQPVSDESSAIVEELQSLLGEAQQEIRLVTYLAHPPALGRRSLAEALKALVEGFGRRTSIQTSFEIRGEPRQLNSDGAQYRVAQEALSNVYRHASAERVRVMLFYRDTWVHLLIADNGCGMPARGIADCDGVGLASMRARLEEVGGRLMVRRIEPGTAVLATVREG
jgi:two-component system NarL family sensor kinase